MKSGKVGLLCLLLLAVPICLLAQTGQGSVTGTVFDNTGAIVPGAAVKLTNEGTGVVQTATTGSDGAYLFALVPPGNYSLTVTASGFAEYVRRGMAVRPSQPYPANVTLQLASVATTIEVTGAAALVQTATSDLTSTVDKNTIEDTPLLSRNVYDLAFLAPQVSLGMDLNAAAGGARESGTAYMLNGAENNNNFSEGAVNVQPALESVSEFTMLTNSMSAQYGRAAGAIISASQKSGTNKFHGVLYEFNRNQNLNANPFFQNREGAPNQHYVRNQFGGEVDGPIIKDKTFFAFGIDKVTLVTASYFAAQVPTASEISAMSKNASPLAQYYMQKYPTPAPTGLCPAEAVNAPTAVGHIGCINLRDPVSYPAMTWFAKVDHNFSPKDRLSFTFNMPRETDTYTYDGGYPSTTPIPAVEKFHNHNISLNQTHTFTPHLLNEFVVAHNRHYDIYTEGNGTTRDPEMIIDGASYGGLGFGYGAYEGGLIEGFVQDRWQFQDNLGWTKGKHSFKFGFGWMWGTLYRNWDLGLPGYYEFGNTTGPTAQSLGLVLPSGALSDPTGVLGGSSTLTNFQNAFPYYQEMAIDPRTGAQANAYRHYIMNDLNWFVQDDWKLSPRVTLNLGLRWERYGAPREANGVLAMFTNFNCLTISCIANAVTGPVSSMWNTRNGDYAPRFGFAWDVFGDGKTSMRAGYGISYDRIFDNIWSNGAWNPPFYGLIDWDLTAGDTLFVSNPPKPSPSYVPNSLPGPVGRVSVRTMENNLKDSSVMNYYYGLEHQFHQNFLLRVNYQGSMGRHLPVLMNWNRYDGMGYNSSLTLTRPNSLYTGFNYRANNVNSSYNAMVVELQKRLSSGLRFQGGYTFSKLIDYGSDLFTGSTTEGQYSSPFYYISNNHENLEKGRGSFDHTNSFKLNISYELPMFRAQHGFVGKAFGGWILSGFYQFYTGHPVEVYNGRSRVKGNAKDANGFPENIGGDYNLDNVANDHPNFVGSMSSVYRKGSPADGIFSDNNIIGCGFAGALSTNIASCNASYGVVTPNSLFVNPPGTGVRYGTLGRNVFDGPSFSNLDAALLKDFKITEGTKFQFRLEGLNLPNHPNFDGVVTNLNSSNFGKAQILAGTPARRIQIGLRLSF